MAKNEGQDRADGGAAFPFAEDYVYSGMSLRDYLAGQALIGLLADTNRTGKPSEFVHDAYLCADAMLAERKKERT